MQLAQDISSRMYSKKRRRSGLRRGFLICIIGEIDKSRCVSYFSTVPYTIFYPVTGDIRTKKMSEKIRNSGMAFCDF